jgi:LTXXQ motif family protein
MMQKMGPGMTHGQPGLTFADPAQIEKLKTELGITPAQETAWTKYAKAVQDAATTMKTTREGVDPDAVSKMTPQDRFAFVTKIREQAQKQFETVKTAANELLATLNDAQKAKAQTILPGLAFGPSTTHSAGAGGPPFRH